MIVVIDSASVYLAVVFLVGWIVLYLCIILQLVHCLCEELVVTLVARVDSNTGGFPVLRSSSSSWFKTSITRFMPHLCFCRPPQLSGGHHEALPYRSQQGCCRTIELKNIRSGYKSENHSEYTKSRSFAIYYVASCDNAQCEYGEIFYIKY